MIRLMNKCLRCFAHLPGGRFILGLALILIIVMATQSRVFTQPEDIFIDNKSDHLKKSRPGVAFPHELHMDGHECLECHHDYQNGENVLDEEALEEDGSAACGACHFKTASINLKTAYHRQCIKCHRTLNRQPDNDLPITCRDCHPKSAK